MAIGNRKNTICHDKRASVGEGAAGPPSTFMAYLILDLSLLGVWRVTGHSLVENEHGELVDITPTQASQDYPFVRHVGTDEEFAAMANAVHVDVPMG